MLLSTKFEHPSTYKNCVSSAAIRQTDDNILKTLASDYNMAEHYLTRSSKFISKLVKEHPMWDRFFESVELCWCRN